MPFLPGLGSSSPWFFEPYEVINAYDAVVTSDGASAHWKLNEPSGNFIDRIAGRVASPNGTITRSQSGLLTAGNASDTATTFSAGYAQSTNATALISATAFSVEEWVQPAALPVSGVTSAMLKGDAVTYWTYGIDVTPAATYQFYIQTGGLYGYTTLTGGTAAVGQTAHIVGTYDGSNICLYVNGALVAGPTVAVLFSSGAPENDAPFNIDRVEPANQLNGTIDEVAYYPTALPLDRVQAHYTIGGGTISAPLSTSQFLSLSGVGS